MSLYYEGKYADAESEARTLLAIQERVLGLEHPDTLKTRNNLAGTLCAEGGYVGYLLVGSRSQDTEMQSCGSSSLPSLNLSSPITLV
jgi:Tetratricopeptide repeat